MVRRILVANRGEIAVRILVACQRLGIEAVLAASEADLDSVPARLADRTVCLGPPPPAESYLNIQAVVAAAAAAGCDAIHPGYGFLSENPGLAGACAAAGLVFIGPPAAQLELAGDKLAAREPAAAAGGGCGPRTPPPNWPRRPGRRPRRRAPRSATRGSTWNASCPPPGTSRSSCSVTGSGSSMPPTGTAPSSGG